MLRIVDIARAFEGRGFPPGIDTRVDFCVVDPIIEANNRGYRITVADGHARVDTIPSAAMTITVGGLAALYSGWLSPTDAVRGGFITGAIGADLATLTPLFAGPMPVDERILLKTSTLTDSRRRPAGGNEPTNGLRR